MNTNKSLKQLAYGHATSNVFKSTGSHNGCWYESYQFLTEALSNPEKLKGWTPVQPYESYSFSELLELIDSEAQVIFEAMTDALNLAKQGLVMVATSSALKNVFNGLDMSHIADLGAKAQA